MSDQNDKVQKQMSVAHSVDQQWQPLVACLDFTARNARHGWIVQTSSNDWEKSPRIRVQYKRDWILVDISGGDKLQPALDEAFVPYMWFLGWEQLKDTVSRNWYRVFHNTVDGHEKLAKLIVHTLIEVFQLKPYWQFELETKDSECAEYWGKHMIAGKFGKRFKLLNPVGRTALEQAVVIDRLIDRGLAKQAAKVEAGKQEVASDVRHVFHRAEQLHLMGSDLIRLAETCACAEAVQVITHIVYGAEDPSAYGVTSFDLEATGIYFDRGEN